MTDISPNDRAPASLGDNNYRVCAVYEGSVPAGQTVVIQCSTLEPVRGRYLFILRKGSQLHVQLCEVEVYAWIGKSLKNVFLKSRLASACPNDVCAQTVRAGCHRSQQSVSRAVSGGGGGG